MARALDVVGSTQEQSTQPDGGEGLAMRKGRQLNHLPPLTALPSADSMRSVQTEASTHAKSR